MSRFDAAVTEYMVGPVHAVDAGAELVDAERLLSARGVSSLAVTGGDGALVGVISRTDLLHIGRHRAAGAGSGLDEALLALPPLAVGERMIRAVVTVGPAATVREAAEQMTRHHIHRVFVVEGGRAVGVLSSRDVMQAVVDERVARPLGEVMSQPVLTVEAATTVAAATDQLAKAHVRGLIVVDYEWPVGIFTQAEALASRNLAPHTPVEDVMNAALLCLPDTLPLFRAARFALATRARRILAVEARHMKGVVSGVDFARVAAGLA